MVCFGCTGRRARRGALFLILLILPFSAALRAAELPPRGWTLGPSAGVHWGTAYEIVYDTSGVPSENEYLSLLVWELNPAVTAGLETRWESGGAQGVTLNLRMAIPGMPAGEVNDFDWLYTDRDWSHWSSSDVKTRWGFILDAGTDWRLAGSGPFTLRLGAGYHLDWWGWKDSVTDSLYSTTYSFKDYPKPFDSSGPNPDGFRDRPDVLTVGVNGINYEAAYHVPHVSVSAALEWTVLSLKLDGRVGPALAFSHDHHLLRIDYGPDGAHFYDSAFGGPWVDTALELTFRTAGRFSMALRGEYAWLNEMRGDTVIVPTDGSPSGIAEDAAGFSFRRAGVTLRGSWQL